MFEKKFLNLQKGIMVQEADYLKPLNNQASNQCNMLFVTERTEKET